VRFLVYALPPAPPADPAGAEIRVALAELRLPARCRVRDLWTHETLSAAERELVAIVPWHGAKLYRLSPDGSSR
jgi:Alpha galactosidase C-terminal beta sandwich domain